MRLFFRYLVYAALLSRGSPCLAQGVTIRVINANNGQPLRDQQVDVSLLYEGGRPSPKSTTHI